MKSSVKKMCEEVQQMLLNGQADDALRLSGEALAIAEANLRGSAHDGYGCGDDFLDSAALHVRLLLTGGMPVEALSCALLCLCTADISAITGKTGHAVGMCDLLTATVIAEMSAIDTLPFSDRIYGQARALTSITGRWLHYCYSGLAESQRSCGRLTQCAHVLGALGATAAIDQDPVIDGETVSPEHTKKYLQEMLGLAGDMRILNIE